MDRPQTGIGEQTSVPETTLPTAAGDLGPHPLAPEAPDVLADQVRAWEDAQGLGSAADDRLAVATGSALERDLADELEAVRHRLAYYERFDSLINDSVQRSVDLFQALFAEREQQRRAGAALAAEVEAAATAEAERQLAIERRTMHETLMTLMTEAGRLQRQVDGLIQQIAVAATDLSARDTSAPDDPYGAAAPYGTPGA